MRWLNTSYYMMRLVLRCASNSSRVNSGCTSRRLPVIASHNHNSPLLHTRHSPLTAGKSPSTPDGNAQGYGIVTNEVHTSCTTCWVVSEWISSVWVRGWDSAVRRNIVGLRFIWVPSAEHTHIFTYTINLNPYPNPNISPNPSIIHNRLSYAYTRLNPDSALITIFILSSTWMDLLTQYKLSTSSALTQN